MDVRIPEDVRAAFLAPFRIGEAGVREAAARPDRTDTIPLDAPDGSAHGELLVMSRAVGPAGERGALLVCGVRVGDVLRVVAAVRAPPDVPGATGRGAAPPLAVLEALAERYGRPMAIGPWTGRFLAAERVELPADGTPVHLRYHVVEGEPVVRLVLSRVEETPQGRYLACALGFTLDRGALQRALGLAPPGFGNVPIPP